MATEIFKAVTGSRLFGTSTPDSDIDMKAVHIPTTRNILLGTADAVITTSTGTDAGKNGAGDEDFQSYPLHKYLRMLMKMDANAVEMLFAPNLLDFPFSYVWDRLVLNRDKLLSNKFESFAGFGRAQAMRYAVRGDRLAALVAVVNALQGWDPTKPVRSNDWATLLTVPGVTTFNGPDGIEYLSVHGRSVPVTARVAEAHSIFLKPIAEAGKRTHKALDNGGADWKGLYHAHRVVDEGIELATTGELRFPLRNAAQYLSIRNGDVSLDEVLDTFEDKMVQLDEARVTSTLRAEADVDWIEGFVAEVYFEQIANGSYRA
jgi:RNA repair pathway DNA polymerase beta family